MPANVRQRTIKPIIEGTVAAGSLTHTDEYVVYARPPAWECRHKTVCHARGEHARDKDGNGFFQFVHNARRRGKAPLGALMSALLA